MGRPGARSTLGSTADRANQPVAVHPTGRSATDSERESGILTSPNRIAFVVPNFVTANDTAANRVPLTTRQKYELAWVSTYDISAHLGNLLESSIQQWTNGEPHYGRNLAAFGKRFAASEGDQATSSLFIHGLLPSLLKEDPRYFRLGKGSSGARLYRAVTRAFVIRTDAGGHTFNTPAILGQLMQAGISNFYYPPQDRSVSGTVKDLGINIVYDAVFNVLKEFYPDVLNKLKRQHTTAPPANVHRLFAVDPRQPAYADLVERVGGLRIMDDVGIKVHPTCAQVHICVQ
jgi:hypothetical protein